MSPEDQNTFLSAKNDQISSDFVLKHYLYRVWRRLIWLAPLSAGLLIPLTLFGLYVWSVANDKIDSVLPFISEVGTLTPQAAFFSQALDCLAMLYALTFFLRYKQLKYQIRQIKSLKCNIITILHAVNWVSVGAGYLFCGLIIFIGNFRANEWQAIHLLAAISAFMTFLIYATGTTFVLEHVHRSGQESAPNTLKGTIIIMFIGMLGAFGTLILSFWIVGADVYDPNTGLRWHSNKLGDTIHDVSAAFQWLIFHTVALHMLCLSRRMYHFEFWSKIQFTQ